MNFQTIVCAETDGHRLIQGTVRRFMADRLRPIAASIDREERFPLEVFGGL